MDVSVPFLGKEGDDSDIALYKLEVRLPCSATPNTIPSLVSRHLWTFAVRSGPSACPIAPS